MYIQYPKWWFWFSYAYYVQWIRILLVSIKNIIVELSKQFPTIKQFQSQFSIFKFTQNIQITQITWFGRTSGNDTIYTFIFVFRAAANDSVMVLASCPLLCSALWLRLRLWLRAWAEIKLRGWWSCWWMWDAIINYFIDFLLTCCSNIPIWATLASTWDWNWDFIRFEKVNKFYSETARIELNWILKWHSSIDICKTKKYMYIWNYLIPDSIRFLWKDRIAKWLPRTFRMQKWIWLK